MLVPLSLGGTPQSVQDIGVAQSSTEVDLDDLIPTAMEGSDTDSVCVAECRRGCYVGGRISS